MANLIAALARRLASSSGLIGGHPSPPNPSSLLSQTADQALPVTSSPCPHPAPSPPHAHPARENNPANSRVKEAATKYPARATTATQVRAAKVAGVKVAETAVATDAADTEPQSHAVQM